MWSLVAKGLFSLYGLKILCLIASRFKSIDLFYFLSCIILLLRKTTLAKKVKAKTIKSPLFDLLSGDWEWKSHQCQEFFVLICSLNLNNLFNVKQNNMLWLCMILDYILRDLIFKIHAFLSLSFQMACNMYAPRTYFCFFKLSLEVR